MAPLTFFGVLIVGDHDAFPVATIIREPDGVFRMRIVGVAAKTVFVSEDRCVIGAMTPLTGVFSDLKGRRPVSRGPGGGVGIEGMTGGTGDIGKPPRKIRSMTGRGTGAFTFLIDEDSMLVRVFPARGVGILAVALETGDMGVSTRQVFTMATLAERLSVALGRQAMVGGEIPVRRVRVGCVAFLAGDPRKPPLKVRTMALGGAGLFPKIEGHRPVYLLFDPTRGVGIQGVTSDTGGDGFLAIGDDLVALETVREAIGEDERTMGSRPFPSLEVGEDRWGPRIFLGKDV